MHASPRAVIAVSPTLRWAKGKNRLTAAIYNVLQPSSLIICSVRAYFVLVNVLSHSKTPMSSSSALPLSLKAINGFFSQIVEERTGIEEDPVIEMTLVRLPELMLAPTLPA